MTKPGFNEVAQLRFSFVKNKLKQDFLKGDDFARTTNPSESLIKVIDVTPHDQTLVEKYAIVDYHIYSPKIACELVFFHQVSKLVGVVNPR